MERARLLLSVTIAHQEQQQEEGGEGTKMSLDDSLLVTSPTYTYSRSYSAPPPAMEVIVRYGTIVYFHCLCRDV